MPLPTRPVTLEDELQMTKVVSTAGGSIQDLNTLRQNIEVLKGGGLARIAKPSKVCILIKYTKLLCNMYLFFWGGG